MPILGADCKLYRNTGSYDSPVWNEVPLVTDVKLNLEKGEADVTTRAGAGWKQRISALKDASVEFDLIWEPGDDDFEAFKDSWLEDSIIDLAVMDGDIEAEGTWQGLRAEMETFSFTRNEALADAVAASVKCMPTFSEHAPDWMVIVVEGGGGGGGGT